MDDIESIDAVLGISALPEGWYDKGTEFEEEEGDPEFE